MGLAVNVKTFGSYIPYIERYVRTNPTCWIQGSPANVRKVQTLWTHQSTSLRTLDKLRAQGHRSAYLEIGTGGGKTLIAAQDALSFIQKNRGARILWIAHRGELLDQAEDTFRELAPEAKINRRFRDTSGRVIDLDGTDIVIISKQTLEKNLQQFPSSEFQYVVVDEAHHAYAEGYQSILKRLSSAFILGITATPQRFSDHRHIRDLFGPSALNMDLLQLIKAGILIENVRFRKVETNVEAEAKLSDAGEFNLPHFWNQIKDTARNEIVANAYVELEAEKKNKPAITFCVSIEHAEQMAVLYKSKGVKVEALHGKLKPEERERILNAYESGELQMLTCIDILNEGYDFPPIEVILMARPTRSKTIWLQQIGRGTRKSPATGKKDLLVIDFVDNLGNSKQQITHTNIFKINRPRNSERSIKTKNAQVEEVFINDVIEMNIEEIFGVVPLQPNELTTGMLAKRIRVSHATINYAIKDGRIQRFVRRNILIAGKEASIFAEEDVSNIASILHPDQVPLQPYELTTTMLAKRVGISQTTILFAIKDGRIQRFVRRTVKRAGKEASVFAEEDVKEITNILHADLLLPQELTTIMLAKKVGTCDSFIRTAIKDGRIQRFVRRTVKRAGKEASIFTEEDVSNIASILHPDQVPLQPYELTTIMLAKRVGVGKTTIIRAIKDERIQGFVIRNVLIAGKGASVFAEEDVSKIASILHADRPPLQPHELTTGMLAKRVGLSQTTIIRAIKDGRIQGFVRRNILIAGKEASVFEEEDIEEIKRILGR